MAENAAYICYIRLRTKPAKRAEFVELIMELKRNVRKHEPGNIFYEFLQGSDSNEFVFFEGYVDEPAQQRHQQAPYHAAMSEAGWSCLEGQPVIEFMTPVGR